jgi:L-lactate dehydrogenase complex protein LldG
VDRESFLAEIAARLGRPRRHALPVRADLCPSPFAADVPVDELGARFARELTLIGGEAVLAASVEDARATLATELGRASGVVSWARAEIARSCGLDLSELWSQLGERCVEPQSPEFRAAALRAQVGVTGADFAIAETGTLVISSGWGRPRAASLLTRLHVALDRQSQLVSRLGSTLTSVRSGTP